MGPKKRAFRKFLNVLLVCAGVSLSTAAPDDPVLLQIQDALQAGNLNAASQLLETGLRQNPRDAGLLNLRGVLHARRNELAQARNDFAESVRLAPNLTPAWQNLARACLLQAAQDPSAASRAADSWRHVLRLKPGDEEALNSLGLLLEQQGKFAESLALLRQLPPRAGSEPGNLILRCADLAALGRTAEAERLASELNQAAEFSEADFESVGNAFDSPKSAPVAVTLLEGLDSRHAADLKALRRLAIAYEQTQRPADARKTLERVALLDPKNTAHLLELARLANAAKDYEGALGYLAHARDLAPSNPQIHFLFAMIASEMDLPVEARSSLDRALALDPGNPAYNYAMGYVILQTRDPASAVPYFRKAIDAKPREVKGHYALGIAYFASGDYAKSQEEMREVENNPKTAGGAEYFLGRIAREQNNLDDAMLHLRKSIELMPDFAESHTELARVYMLQKNLDKAKTELDNALRIDANSFQANLQLLVFYRRTHDARAADQAELVKKLDEERSRRAELMLRTVEVRP